MIYLEQGQKLADRPELVVYEQTGERNDADMVICAKAETPTEPFCWLEAQYIAYGGLVYRVSDDKELETEILKIDPDTTFSDIATDPLSSPTATEDVVVENAVSSDAINQTEPVSQPVSQPVIEPVPEGQPVSATASTTPATTTPATTPIEVPVEELPNVSTSTATTSTEVSSSTPTAVEPVVQELNTSTTTDPIVTSATRRRTKKGTA